MDKYCKTSSCDITSNHPRLQSASQCNLTPNFDQHPSWPYAKHPVWKTMLCSLYHEIIWGSRARCPTDHIHLKSPWKPGSQTLSIHAPEPYSNQDEAPFFPQEIKKILRIEEQPKFAEWNRKSCLQNQTLVALPYTGGKHQIQDAAKRQPLAPVEMFLLTFLPMPHLRASWLQRNMGISTLGCRKWSDPN